MDIYLAASRPRKITTTSHLHFGESLLYIKGLDTTHSYTKHTQKKEKKRKRKKEKKPVEKEGQQKKAKYASIKKQKAKKIYTVDKSANNIYQ